MSELGAGSGTSYPTALDTDSTLEVDSPSLSKTKARAACINDANAAIVALETTLGTSPQGSVGDVKTFLQTEHNTDGTHGTITVGGVAITATPTANAPAQFDAARRMNINAPAFMAYLSTDQTGITTATPTKITFQTELFDTNANYDNVTNYRFTPTVAGKYLLQTAAACKGATGTTSLTVLYLYKNGEAFAKVMDRYPTVVPTNTATNSSPLMCIVDANGTTDYFEIYLAVTVSTGTATFISWTSTQTWFTGIRVGI